MPSKSKPATTRKTLALDEATSDDLSLFGASPDEPSLFNYCNHCTTQGGARVLLRRMQAPWAEGSQIRATQRSLEFILEHSAQFAKLPSDFLADSVDKYLHDSLPIITDDGRIEFGMAAFSMWANEDRFYIRIIKGVGLTSRFVRTLRAFIRSLPAPPDSCELAPWFAELEELLSIPMLAAIPEEKTDRWFWHTLRTDQVFRHHHQNAVRRLLALNYELDALVGMAAATRKHRLVMPTVEEGEVRISATELVHPFVAEPVPNPLEMSQQRRVLFLTGPNMAGKTTYLRSVATALYLAHLGMGVPARSFAFVPVESLLTAISLSDDLNTGVSYFRAEALRVKAVAEAVAEGRKVVAIMDEPFKGTNVKDAFDASLAILRRFAERNNCLFMISSHLIELSERLQASPAVDYRYFEAKEEREKLSFDYALQEGVSSQRLGMRVLEEEGIFSLLDNAGSVKR